MGFSTGIADDINTWNKQADRNNHNENQTRFMQVIKQNILELKLEKLQSKTKQAGNLLDVSAHNCEGPR